MDTIRFDEAVEELEKEISRVKSINEMYARIDAVRESVETEFIPEINNIKKQVEASVSDLDNTFKDKSKQLMEKVDNGIAELKKSVLDKQVEALEELNRSTNKIRDDLDGATRRIDDRILTVNSGIVEELGRVKVELATQLSNQNKILSEQQAQINMIQSLLEKEFKLTKILQGISIAAIIASIVCVVLCNG